VRDEAPWTHSRRPAMTDPRLLLSDTRLDEIERDAAHSRRLGLTVTFAVVSEQLAFVQELRRLRCELEEARAALRNGQPGADREAAPPRRERSTTPLEVEVTIVQRDASGHELSRVRRRMPAEEERGDRS
jgi:hypothetical protein